MMGWPNTDYQLLRIEIGPRALLHLDPKPRDMRWWRNVAEKAGWT